VLTHAPRVRHPSKHSENPQIICHCSDDHPTNQGPKLPLAIAPHSRHRDALTNRLQGSPQLHHASRIIDSTPLAVILVSIFPSTTVLACFCEHPVELEKALLTSLPSPPQPHYCFLVLPMSSSSRLLLRSAFKQSSRLQSSIRIPQQQTIASRLFTTSSSKMVVHNIQR